MNENALPMVGNPTKFDESEEIRSTKNKPLIYEVVRVEMEDEALIEEVAFCIAQMIFRYGQKPD